MSRFNYLSDAPPQVIDRVRTLRIPVPLRLPLAAFMTSCVIVTAWWGLERYWIESARREVANAALRLAASKAAFAKTRLVRSNVDQLLSFDKRLRSIRLSGSRLSQQLATIADHVPAHTWLTSIGRADEGIQLDGHASGLAALSNAVADLMKADATPRLVRAGRDHSSGSSMAFTVVLSGGK